MKQQIILAGMILSATISAAQPAWADYHVVSPNEIDLGELEIEHNGSSTYDHLPGQTNAQSYTAELGTGLTRWWHSEIEFGWDRAPGGGRANVLTQIVTENTFRLTNPGQYWADVGIYAEYGQTAARGKYAGSNELTFGPAIAKDVGHTTTTINLFLTRQFGPDQTNHGLDFSYAGQTRWNLWGPLSPGAEIYGDTGTLTHGDSLPNQQLLAGPALIGALRLNELGLGHAGKLKYSVGYLHGLTNASPTNAVRWNIEMELPF
jgi:hypothetical protein